MFDLKTSTDTPNATSSPAWAGGQLQLDLLDGQTPVNSGPRLARASRSRSRAKEPGLMGYPLAHLFCGATAMQSFRNSRQKSLARGSTSTLEAQESL